MRDARSSDSADRRSDSVATEGAEGGGRLTPAAGATRREDTAKPAGVGSGENTSLGAGDNAETGRAHSPEFIHIPPPPWEKKCLDVDQQQATVRQEVAGSAEDERAEASESDSGTSGGEVSPKQEGQRKGKKAKLGNKAADLFAKIQSKLSASKA